MVSYASHVCILAYWAVKGGIAASENVRRLAAKPTSQSGKFSSRFDKDRKLEAAGRGSTSQLNEPDRFVDARAASTCVGVIYVKA